MTDSRKQDRTARRPDCVTEIRMGNSVLVVSGFYKENSTETAAPKMAGVLEAEAATANPAFFPTIKYHISHFCRYTDSRPMWYNQGTE